MIQQYALKEDFEDRMYRFLKKNHMYDNLNFGIHRLDTNWLQVINKNVFGDVIHRLWKIRYKEDMLKEVYREFDLALREFAL